MEMPNEEVDKITVVCNTGPLISAFQCGRVDLLKRYFKTIYIALSQVAEFEKHGASEELDDLIQEGFVVLAETLTADEKDRAETLARRIAAQPSSGDPDYRNHLPEAEAMVVATRPELGCVRILLDELAARAVAEEEGLRITGFPGVVGRAGLDGLLTRNEIRHLLGLCQQQGTHYSNRLIEHVAEMYGR
jgi:predicted nucleic acid-binding protein